MKIKRERRGRKIKDDLRVFLCAFDIPVQISCFDRAIV